MKRDRKSYREKDGNKYKQRDGKKDGSREKVRRQRKKKRDKRQRSGNTWFTPSVYLQYKNKIQSIFIIQKSTLGFIYYWNSYLDQIRQSDMQNIQNKRVKQACDQCLMSK